ncbi:hypothetical protein J6TS7_38900 [Paenibacillus dendritiformis]|nr:hypothetical protein J6TS7_38900 [Paenibacillus dendritiformis]
MFWLEEVEIDPLQPESLFISQQNIPRDDARGTVLLTEVTHNTLNKIYALNLHIPNTLRLAFASSWLRID